MNPNVKRDLIAHLTVEVSYILISAKCTPLRWKDKKSEETKRERERVECNKDVERCANYELSILVGAKEGSIGQVLTYITTRSNMWQFLETQFRHYSQQQNLHV